ncbi:MAG: hypothetical protein R3C30_06420 [Hyphomonadaceae bacterium]
MTLFRHWELGTLPQMIEPNPHNAGGASRPYWVFALAGLGADGVLQISHRTWLMQAGLDLGMFSVLALILVTQTLAGAMAAVPLSLYRLRSTLIYGALATVAHQVASFFAVLLMGAIVWALVIAPNLALSDFRLRALIDGSTFIGFAVLYVLLLFFVWRRFAPDAQAGHPITS